MERVPKLRFSEFEGEWREVESEELFENISDKGHEDKTVLTIIQGFGTIPRSESGRNIQYDEASLVNYKLAKKGDFIIHLRSFEGGLEISNEDGILSPAYTILRAKEEIGLKFYYEYFHTNKFINGVLAKAVEGIRDGRQISYNMFKWLKIVYPSLEEQKKISNFLSKVDERMSVQEKIISDLEKQKKGLMQKLFSQEVRFKNDDGSEYPDWKEKTLVDLCCKIGSGKTPKGGKETYVNCGIALLRSQNIRNGFLDISDVVYITDEVNNTMLATEVIIGDILLNITGASIGRCCLYNISLKANVNQHVCIIRLNQVTEIDRKFLLQQFISEFVQKQIRDCQNGGSREGLNFQQISNFKIVLPCMEEQKKIARCLSIFDKKIEIERTILEDWKQIKKGFLQQMFV